MGTIFNCSVKLVDAIIEETKMRIITLNNDEKVISIHVYSRV